MSLKPYKDMEYDETLEKLLGVLRTSTHNTSSDGYFRVLLTHYMGIVAASMRVQVESLSTGPVPVNTYALLLGESGMGKTRSAGFIERELLEGFRGRLLAEVMPATASLSIDNEAMQSAAHKNTSVDDERNNILEEFNSCGPYLFSFDSGTTAAFKQMRDKCQISQSGALNLICDEIGSNIASNEDLFKIYLEAYDVGMTKAKLVKNTKDNQRNKDRNTPVPSTLLAYGTPTKLFNGGAEERLTDSYLEAGYGRRFLYGYGVHSTQGEVRDPKEVIANLKRVKALGSVQIYKDMFTKLASIANYKKVIHVPEAVEELMLEYKFRCEDEAEKLSIYHNKERNELQHRYFKLIKVAGIYAFVEGNNLVTEDNFYAAMKLVEDSGACYKKHILRPESAHIKLAKYICENSPESGLTHAELTDSLPFYPASKHAREDLLTLATAWGITNNHIIKRELTHNVEFIKGETLQATKLDAITLSASDHQAFNFGLRVDANWSKLPALLTATSQTGDPLHWCVHGFVGGHRAHDNVIKGFNLAVFDIDGTATIELAQQALSDYSYIIQTTKSHTPNSHRFRLIIPMSHKLHLDVNEFNMFMTEVTEWLPFPIDAPANEAARKWETNANAIIHTNDGKLLDVLPFIPKTAQNVEYKKGLVDLKDLDKVQRWFLQDIDVKGRNNTLLKYALMLLDGGHDITTVEAEIVSFNQKLPNPLMITELKATVIKTLYKKGANI